MQVLDVQPSNPTPYTPAGGTYNNNPVPGAGGLPALSGLSNRMNPMAAELQSKGRGEDSMLVHMTPDEVNSLRGLAQQFGGDLTTNPHTGLPEAGWLGKLLPTLLGFGLNFIPGVGPLLAAGITAAGTTAVTGDLQKGLMAGLGAFGGASLGTAAGLGVAKEAATGAITGGLSGAAAGTGTGVSLPTIGIQSAGSAVPTSIGAGALGGGAVPTVVNTAGVGAGLGASIPGLSPAVTAPLNLGAGVPGPTGIIGKFSNAAREGIHSKLLQKIAPYAAGAGLLNTVSELSQPNLPKYNKEEEEAKNKWNYEGPYLPMPRRLDPRVSGQGEIQYFDQTNPIGYLTAGGQPRGVPGYAEGGEATDDIKARAAKLIAEGYTDPKTGNFGTLMGDPFSAGVKPGAVSDLGGLQFVVNNEGKWEYKGPIPGGEPAAQPTTPAPLPPSQRLTLTGVPLIDTTKNTITDTSTPKGTTVTDTTTNTAVPAATQSGFGVQTLADKYVPSFTQKADYVTPKNDPYVLGGQLAAALPGFVSQFQTSPGPITASRTYPGGSPSEKIRAAAQTNAAAKAATPEIDYGFAKSAGNLMPSTGGTAIPGTADFWANLAAQYGYNPNVSLQYADGGEVEMGDGSFVVDARTVSELGNGSSNAGIDILERLGGKAVRGPGDGVSDSVPAKIGGKQEARVARDEVIFSPEAVQRLGGAKKLYALMDKAHKARKRAGRGTDTKVAKGLGALA